MGREISYRAGGRGRDGSQGQGQAGRGRGSQDNKPKTYTTSSKALEMKFIPHGIRKDDRQTATYQTVKDYTSYNRCRSHLEMEKMSQTPEERWKGST
jgi:hypothetical protein